MTPARQTEVRLSQSQRVELEVALDPHTLTRPLLHAIEDSLHVYRQARAGSRSGEKRLDAWLTKHRRAEALAGELRELLPLVKGEDDALIALIEQRRARWKAWADRVPPLAAHRPTDEEIRWLGLSVVEALDGAHVRLTLGRATPVVEVLGLVCDWAAALDGRARSTRRRDDGWKSRDYELSRAIVEQYRSLHPQRSQNTR